MIYRSIKNLDKVEFQLRPQFAYFVSLSNHKEGEPDLWSPSLNFDAIDSFREIMPPLVPSTKLSGFFKHLDDLRVAFNVFYAQPPGGENLRELMFRIRLFELEFIRPALYSLDLFRQNLLPKIEDPSSEEKAVELIFEGATDLQTFAERLNLIQSVYNQLCEIAGVSIDKYPIRIRQIESGSEYLELAVNGTVAIILTKALVDASKFVFRRFFREGDLEFTQKLRDEASDAIDLRAKMVDAGLDTDFLDEQIVETAERVGENLLKLTSKCNTITVNDEVIDAVEIQKAENQQMIESGLPNLETPKLTHVQKRIEDKSEDQRETTDKTKKKVTKKKAKKKTTKKSRKKKSNDS